MTHAEICAAICDALEPNVRSLPVDEWKWHGCHVLIAGHPEKYRAVALDFYSDEAASARLLEAMPLADLSKQEPSMEWRCDPWGGAGETPSAYDTDRKTAIVLAACAWLSIPATLDDNQREGG